jgi:chemotaxis protein MotB
VRKKKHPEHVNHERWLVSYADFITLLFAFFVVMFAVSQVDSKKVGRFTESFSKAVGIDVFPQSGESLLPGGVRAEPAAEEGPADSLPSELVELKRELAQLSRTAEVPSGFEVIERRTELVIRLADHLLFETGDDTPRDPRTIGVIAKALRKTALDVRVEGHTDDRPINTSRFRSNWELSTARSTAVIALFAKEGIPAHRLAAAGYGEFHPVAPNTTEEGRKQNRRVDIVVSVAAPAGGAR